jgi:D-sedoheptulose 7-phosphate isomerase
MTSPGERMVRYFPDRLFEDAGTYASAYFTALSDAWASVSRQAIAAAGDLLAERTAAGRMVLSCGNGGSAAIANHLACDCLKGVRTGTALKPRVHSLATTVELMTAISNDISYDQVFAYQLESMGEAGDVLIAISSSGSSPNILNALRAAKTQDMATIALTGFAGGAALELADVGIYVAAHNYGVVEDVHQSVMHVLAQYLRHRSLSDPTALGHAKF